MTPTFPYCHEHGHSWLWCDPGHCRVCLSVADPAVAMDEWADGDSVLAGTMPQWDDSRSAVTPSECFSRQNFYDRLSSHADG